MLPVVDMMDSGVSLFGGVGRATFDTCMRFLGESVGRLRTLRRHFKKANFRCYCEGRTSWVTAIMPMIQ